MFATRSSVRNAPRSLPNSLTMLSLSVDPLIALSGLISPIIISRISLKSIMFASPALPLPYNDTSMDISRCAVAFCNLT